MPLEIELRRDSRHLTVQEVIVIDSIDPRGDHFCRTVELRVERGVLSSSEVLFRRPVEGLQVRRLSTPFRVSQASARQSKDSPIPARARNEP